MGALTARRLRRAALGVSLVASAAVATAVARDHGAGKDPPAAIEIVSLRETAAGGMLDLRYRIRDGERAAPLFDRTAKVVLVDEASGARLGVPRTRLGAMRQAGFQPDLDRTYVILFANSGRRVKPGARMTLEAGDVRIEGISVQ